MANYDDTHAVLCSTLRSLGSFQFGLTTLCILSILHSRCRKSMLLRYLFFNAACSVGKPPVKIPTARLVTAGTLLKRSAFLAASHAPVLATTSISAAWRQ